MNAARSPMKSRNCVANWRWAAVRRGASPALQVNCIAFHAQVLSGVTGKDLPSLIDQIKTDLGSGVVLLIADTGDKAAIAVGVTADLTARVSAVDILRAVTPELGGKGGGGRPDMAQGGGASTQNADAAITQAKSILENLK